MRANLSRRSFTKFLGLAPLAVKAASDAEIAKSMELANGAGPFQYSITPLSHSLPSTDYLKVKTAAAQYIEHFGVPDFVLESSRRNAQYVGRLDPDLAAKKSWSMSVKILTQRERNLARNIKSFKHAAWQAQRASIFQKLTGWDWPW